MKAIGMYDGKIVELDQPAVRLEDRGYQYGDGIYDAWAMFNGRHLLLNEHLDRLERSAGLLGIEPSFTRRELIRIIDEMAASSGLRDAMVYVQWTRGWISPRSHVNDPKAKAVLSGFVSPPHDLPEEYFSSGTKNYTYPDLRHLYCNIKTLNLIGNILAKNEAAGKGGYEAIFIREMKDGPYVTECSHSNCFAVKDGVLYTAPNGPYILPGITRGAVIGLARKNGIEVVEKFCTPDFYLKADEALITNSMAVVPISHIDDKPIGTGKAGPVTKRIMALYRGLVDEVCRR